MCKIGMGRCETFYFGNGTGFLQMPNYSSISPDLLILLALPSTMVLSDPPTSRWESVAASIALFTEEKSNH